MANPTNVARRELLMTLPALALAPVAAAGLAPPAVLSAPAATDPHPAWLAEWRQRKDYWEHADEDTPDEKTDAICELGGRIAFTRARTSEGAVAQMEYAIEEFTDFAFGNTCDDRDEAVMRNLLETLRGLA